MSKNKPLPKPEPSKDRPVEKSADNNKQKPIIKK